MNWKDIKNIIKEELKEATTVSAGNTKFNFRTGVNKNPTKLGIKIQFEPKGEPLGPDAKAKLEVALQEKLNGSLKEYDIQISKDTDVPRPDVIGFFIPLAQLKNLIVKSLTGKAEAPAVQAPEPEGDEEELAEIEADDDTEFNVSLKHLLKKHTTKGGEINEMRVRDLNEISRVIRKEDFYEFINKGNNIVRTLEEAGMTNGKKYLAYLVKHNIM